MALGRYEEAIDNYRKALIVADRVPRIVVQKSLREAKARLDRQQRP
jgi:hypothetical protein